jgi:alkylation response protein AidB-like acyl-CoA dehydrogenase
MSAPPTLVQQINRLFQKELPAESTWLDQLRRHGLDVLPMPGSGNTLLRWQALAAVASFDLSLAKLYESHTDALAILQELAGGHTDSPAGSWGVWAAEAPTGRTILDSNADNSGRAVLTGSKCWCSGAASADNALVTAWADDGAGPFLVSVALNQSSIEVDTTQWKAVGMAGSASLDVRFNGSEGRVIGDAQAYLRRPGFWQGGAGVAACWFGGALSLANHLRSTLEASVATPQAPFKLAALGKVDLALQETAGVLREAAAWIDAHPVADASRVAMLARLSAEQCAKVVLDEVGKAVGAGPFCRDEKFARAAADLPVFIRQSHAEKDFYALGQCCLKDEALPWTL